MKAEEVRGLSDSDLVLFIEAAQEEKRQRDEKRRQETIARIKELAAGEGIAVHIDGMRGRPPKVRMPANDNQKPLAFSNDNVRPEKAVRNGK